jgi:hypothetical protein
MAPAPTRAALTVALLLLGAQSADALEARIGELRIIGRTVRASMELREMLPAKLGRVLAEGGALHVRIQAELWEDRPLWDRMVRPALVSVFRIVRDPTTARISISDAVGSPVTYAAMPEPLSLRVDVVPVEAISDAGRYYLRMIATVGTLGDRDIEDTGAAVFGRDEGTISLGRMGKMIFSAVLQVSDYLQSVSAEVRSRPFRGSELRSGLREP